MERIYLLCLKAPEHVTTKLTHTRNLIFNETGIVSALALDPVIPLSFHLSPPEKRDFTEIKFLKKPFKTKTVKAISNSVFLEVNNSHDLKQITSLTEAPVIMNSIFTPFPGFYISATGENDDIKTITGIIEESGLTDISWNNGSLEVLEICFGSSRIWFNSIDWTSIWEQKVTSDL